MPNVAIGIGISAIFLDKTGIDSDLSYVFGEVGDVSPEDVMAMFNKEVYSPTSDFLSGVTIRINSVVENFESATRQANRRLVLYSNTTDFADANDNVTWEYDDDFGNMQDYDGNPMVDISVSVVKNRVGMHLYGDNDEELIRLVTL